MNIIIIQLILKVDDMDLSSPLLRKHTHMHTAVMATINDGKLANEKLLN